MIGKVAKAEKITVLHEKFAESQAAIVAGFSGLNVHQMAELRGQLRATHSELQVVKNTLARRAATDTVFASLSDQFVGPTSITFTSQDVIAVAKALTDYAKKEPKFSIRAGFVEGQVLSAEQVAALAELPPREVLLSRLLASMQSPVSGFVGVLQGVLRQFLYVLQAVKEAKEQASQ